MTTETALKTPINWPLLPLPDKNGRIHYPDLESGVRQSIQIILRTRPGERLMRARFGAGLANYLHEPNTLTTRRRIHDLITQALEQWETRIVLDRVEVREVEGQPQHVRIELAYRLRRTGAAQQLGLTMQLEA
jgi:uncharacterized protein